MTPMVTVLLFCTRVRSGSPPCPSIWGKSSRPSGPYSQTLSHDRLTHCPSGLYRPPQIPSTTPSLCRLGQWKFFRSMEILPQLPYSSLSYKSGTKSPLCRTISSTFTGRTNLNLQFRTCTGSYTRSHGTLDRGRRLRGDSGTDGSSYYWKIDTWSHLPTKSKKCDEPEKGYEWWER